MADTAENQPTNQHFLVFFIVFDIKKHLGTNSFALKMTLASEIK